MGWKFVESFLLIGSMFIILFVAFYAFKYKKSKTSRILFFMMLSTLVWTIGDYFEIQATEISSMIFWRNIQQVGAFTLPVISLWLAVTYTDQRKWTRFITLAFLISAITIALIFTNELHYFMRTGYEVVDSPFFGTTLVVQSTILGLFLVTLNFMHPITAIIHLSIYYKKAPRKIQKILYFLIMAYIWTVLATFSKMAFLGNIGIMISISTLYIPSVVLIFYALFKYNLFSIAPIARDRIFDSTDRAIIIVNMLGEVVDYNYNAEKLFLEKENPIQIKNQTWDKILENMKVQKEQKVDQDVSIQEVTIQTKEKLEYYQIYSFVLKDITKEVLGNVLLFTNQTSQKEEEALLRQRATIDYLTNIYNRIAFENEYDLLANDMSNYPLTMLLMDLDRFKDINDTFGHQCGDRVLIHFSSLLKSFFDENAVVGRVGGEEFAVALPRHALESANQVAEQFRILVEKSQVKLKRGPLNYTVSIGLSSSKDSKKSYDEIVREADKALYEAKRNGRNQAVSFSFKFEKNENFL